MDKAQWPWDAGQRGPGGGSGVVDEPVVSFTAVYLKGKHGYVGFVEELPGVNSHGQTIEAARENLHLMVGLAFDEERARSAEWLRGKDVVREQFRVAIPVN